MGGVEAIAVLQEPEASLLPVGVRVHCVVRHHLKQLQSSLQCLSHLWVCVQVVLCVYQCLIILSEMENVCRSQSVSLCDVSFHCSQLLCAALLRGVLVCSGLVIADH